MKKYFFLTFILSWFLIGLSIAQTNQCATKTDSTYYAKETQLYHNKLGNEPSMKLLCSSPYDSCKGEFVIPVVFHIVRNPSKDVYISDGEIHTFLEKLNAFYEGTHPLQSYLDPYFASLSAGNTNIRFVLTSVDENGKPHSGIERRDTDKASFQADNYASLADMNVAIDCSNSPEIVKKYVNGGLDPWNHTNFLNIWVCRLDALGIGTFPWHDVIRPHLSGVVMHTDRVVGNYTTGAHEVGHWLGLYHTFEDDCKPGCEYETGDKCLDTPRDNSTSNVCGDSYNCGEKNMNQNIMDYEESISSTCRRMFTIEQAQRMKCLTSDYRSSFGGGGGAACISQLSSPNVATGHVHKKKKKEYQKKSNFVLEKT